MAEKLNFELVSPERKLVEKPVRMAVIPGEEGEMGIGSDHTSLVVSLQPGSVRLYEGDNDKDYMHIFIAGGFADISGTQCTVLAEEAFMVRDFDKADLVKNLERLEHDLSLAVEEADKARLRGKIAMVQAKLTAVKEAA